MSAKDKTTEEKNDKPAENQPEVKSVESSDGKVEISKEDTVSIRDEKVSDKPVKSNLSQLEELPDSVKKHLEKKKAEKTESKKKKRKKKVDRRVPVGKAFVKATYNNTIVTLTDTTGNVLSWASAGIAGFRGPKKSTPYAASIITRIAVEKAKEYGLSEVGVFVKGVGTGRESAIRALNANGLVISFIKDITPIPHGGVRPKKPRRV